ncbi:hypothetical protein [Gimesia sp.]|uniref:hypothetical protein n=1 Tax=Gimesia sp. TaxID=2024833 RepID=UPI003A9488B0
MSKRRAEQDWVRLRYALPWETEWETISVDPMLLKHLGKSLYVVLAHWDLTPLEQAVLRDAQ